MNILLLLILFMLATKSWTSCDASRKMLMVQMDAEGKGGVFLIPKKLLSESANEENGMDTELILPDDSDDDKPEIIIDAESKRLKQQRDPLMEALEDQTEEEEKKKQQEGESTLPESGDGDLLLEESEEEKWVGEIPKKKTYNGEESISETDSSGLVTRERVQKQEEGRFETKKEKAVVEEKPEEDWPDSTENVEGSKGFPGEASPEVIAEIKLEAERDGSTIIGKGKKDEQAIIVSTKHQARTEEEATEQDDAKAGKRTKTDEVDGTVEAEKQENGDVSDNVKSEGSDNDLKTKKIKGEGAVTRKKVGKGGVLERSKSKGSDDKDLTEEAVAEEIAEEETPAELIEREMRGGVEDLDMSASKGRNIWGKEQQKKDITHTTNFANANESEGRKNKLKPSNNFKTSKKPKSDILQDGDSEVKGSNARDDKRARTKAKKKKDSQSELDVISTDAEDTAVLMSKQVGMDNTTKAKMKKKKKEKSDKLKKEVKPNEKGEENSSNGLQQEEKSSEKVKKKPSEKVKGKISKKSKKEDKSSQKDKEKSSNKADKHKQSIDEETMDESEHSKLVGAQGGEDIQDVRILEVVDDKNGDIVKNRKKGDEKEKPLKGREEELPTIEKQEEKLEIEVQDIAKEAQEKAEGLISVLKSASSLMQGADEEDDEYSDFMQDFSDLSTKFQDTALKVADHLGPNIQKLTDTSKTYFNKANQHITDSFSPIVGKQFAPFLASLVSYGLLLVPLAVVILLFEHIRALLSLQKVVFFVNIYLAAYFATLLLATFIMGEPMTFFYKSSASGYVHLQLLQALGYIIYLTLQTIDLASSCSLEAFSVKVTVVLQWFVAVTVGFHYYVTVFHRAMALKGPHINWKIYGIYSTAFLVLCIFARIKRVKKGYILVGQEETDKRH